jgi:hypothetical protein
MSKMPSHYSFKFYMHELRLKERPKVKLLKIRLLITNPFRIRGQMISNWGVQYTIGNIFLKAIKLCHCMLQIGVFEEDMNVQSFKSIIVVILGLSFKSSLKKCHSDVAPMNSHRV